MEAQPRSKRQGVTHFPLDPGACACKVCHQREHCLPGAEAGQGLDDLELAMRGSRSLKDGQALFHQSDVLSGIYAIRAGCLKSFRASRGGHEQVFGFHLPGDLIGLEAIDPGVHGVSVMSLGTSLVCRFDLMELERLAERVPHIHHQLLRIMSRELALQWDRDLERPAGARISAFLLRMSKRLAQRGADKDHFNLPMPRRDMANYLRMAPETVSRMLRGMIQSRIIYLHRREVTILDQASLEREAARG
ncbi:CRP/FNR family transcriptional regulator [Natronospira proteinivora]|uniref:CRP/FNR family transcriptional regulator n=1 Tax=Natronospira proteinivora TaxID=1807133 RepID=A0ABT1G7L2_9GAMM|nr:helix-turn-helix domain-containing protein [Natronospira proteinivora]MCP1727294.1 CRP/FNR family transcriptional regulator [Natronospira proteinivora]